MTEEIIVKHMKGNLLIKNVDVSYQKIIYKGTEITIAFNIN
jgi:hypothetical protein